MHTMRWYVNVGVALAVVFVLGFILGGRLETQANNFVPGGTEQPPAEISFDPVWKAWRVLDEKFVPSTTTDAVSEQDRVWGIVAGLADSYNDPYTVFMPPEEAKIFEEEISGEFAGVGIEMGFREGMLTVIAPLKGTPAERAGFRSGDIIVEVDGTRTDTLTMDEAIAAIRGDVGTTVVFTVARKGEDEFITIPVVRDIIEVPTLDYEVVDGDVFVISLYNFYGTAVREMRAALRVFVRDTHTKLVIDLRGNPGGYLSAAVEIASLFLPIGKTIVTEDYGASQEPQVHRSKGEDITKKDWRIALLVDGGSASASEILAGALREHGKAVLIGEQTFGKGSVQELVKITPETSLKVTVARWLTPEGHSISAAGLTPDLVISMTPEDMDEGRDPQKDAAIRYVRTGILENPLSQASSTASSTPLDDFENVE